MKKVTLKQGRPPADASSAALIRISTFSVVEQLEGRQLFAFGPVEAAAFKVNSFTTNAQSLPVVASDANGNFVVAWQSANQDGSNLGIYAQRYNASGVAQGSEFLVNTFTTGAQQNPSIAMDPAGDFVITWQSNGQDGSNFGIYARAYSSSGTATSAEVAVNSYTTLTQQNPSVGVLSGGSFIVAWESRDQVASGSSYDIYARKFSSSGSPAATETLVNSFTTGSQTGPAIAIGSGGDVVVAWNSSDQVAVGSSSDIFARQLSSSAIPSGSEIQVNTYTTFSQRFPSIAVDSTGNFVVAWDSNNQDGSAYGVYARKYNSSGVPTTDEIRANTFTSGNQRFNTVSIDSDGDFVVGWASLNQDLSNYGVYYQRFTSAGATVDANIRVNDYTTNAQTTPSIAMENNGDFVVAFASFGQDGDNYGVYARRYAEPVSDTAPNVTSSTFNYLTSQNLQVVFDQDVSASLSSADVTMLNLTTSQTIATADITVAFNSTTNTATITYTPGGSASPGIFPDGWYRATMSGAGVTSIGGTPMAADYVTTFFVLAGDTNRDRAINIVDLGTLATNWQGSGRNFSTGDFNYDGLVNIVDLGILAGSWQKTLPSAPPAVVAVAKLAPGAANVATAAAATQHKRTTDPSVAEQVLDVL